MSGHSKPFVATDARIRMDRRAPSASPLSEVSEVAKGIEAAKQADAAALLAGAGAAGPPHKEGRAALSQHAGDVAGICYPIDRRHCEPQHSATEPADEGRSVIDEGGGNIDSEGLHFAGLRVNLNI